ncbi:MAG: endoribonuclease MazF [Ignavibacteria bacterium]|nr:MAG: endoribonuclease MazF [Ignavibacteria bacterium]
MVMGKGYVPARGDIVWLQFNPLTGHEQAGKRPALVISPSQYNSKVGLALFCPITNQIKGYPFEVNLPKNSKISGTILTDQVKSLDWKARKAKLICKLPNKLLKEVIAKIHVLIS